MYKQVWTYMLMTVAIVFCQSALAQLRPPPPQQMRIISPGTLRSSMRSNMPAQPLQQPQTVSPEAYRRMDTHSSIDPRILFAQQQAKEAEEKARRIEAKKWEYRRALRDSVNRTPELSGLQGNALVSREQAQEDAAQYFVLRDTQGSAQADRWLSNRKAQIRTSAQDARNTQAVLTLYHTAGIVASAGAQAASTEIAASASRPLPQEELVRLKVSASRQAAKAASMAESQADDMHYDLLVRFTEQPIAPVIEPLSQH